jgi:hypothetical protein
MCPLSRISGRSWRSPRAKTGRCFNLPVYGRTAGRTLPTPMDGCRFRPPVSPANNEKAAARIARGGLAADDRCPGGGPHGASTHEYERVGVYPTSREASGQTL